MSRCAFYSPYDNSGISVFKSVDTDANTTDYKVKVVANRSFGNRNTIPGLYYRNGCCITDGNGVIIDTNREPDGLFAGKVYAGKTLVANNLLYGNGGSGAHVFKSDHVDMVNNVAYQNGQSHGETPDSPEGELFGRQASGLRFYDNVLWARPGLRATVNDALSDVIYDYNVLFDGDTDVLTAFPLGPHDRKVDPAFVAPGLDANADFHPKSGSPLIDSGTAMLAPATDIDGTPRPSGSAVDIGAYEVVAAAGDASPDAASPKSDLRVRGGCGCSSGAQQSSLGWAAGLIFAAARSRRRSAKTPAPRPR